MKIYTKTGDKGMTGLFGARRVSKAHPRVAAYGEIDELNSALGAAIALLPGRSRFKTLRAELGEVQADLFAIGAALASPDAGGKNDLLPADAAKRLEAGIDRMTRDLAPLRNFILPGGAPAAAALFLARAVCRRAERAICSLKDAAGPEPVLAYVNRLSDHLFTAGRWANMALGREETPWKGPRRN